MWNWRHGISCLTQACISESESEACPPTRSEYSECGVDTLPSSPLLSGRASLSTLTFGPPIATSFGLCFGPSFLGLLWQDSGDADSMRSVESGQTRSCRTQATCSYVCAVNSRNVSYLNSFVVSQQNGWTLSMLHV